MTDNRHAAVVREIAGLKVKQLLRGVTIFIFAEIDHSCREHRYTNPKQNLTPLFSDNHRQLNSRYITSKSVMAASFQKFALFTTKKSTKKYKMKIAGPHKLNKY